MDNSVSIVTPPQFVVNVVQVTGGATGFSVLAGTTNFVVEVMASVGSGGGGGLEYTQDEKDKLAAIEAGATIDQTGGEIKTAYELEAQTNAFTDTEKSKLAAIEDNATADQTDSQIETAYNAQVAKISAGEITAGTEPTVRRFSPDDVEAMIQVHAPEGGSMSDAEVKTAYENNANTNEFSDAEKTKLGTVETSAKDDQTGGEIKTAYENEGNTNAFTDSEKAKLGSIDANHYGDPLQSTVALTALLEANITDKERRYVEDETSDYFYDTTAGSGDLAPDDQTGGTGWWKKVVSSGDTAASIKTKYESNPDTNAFTDTTQSKLAGIEAGAKDDQTDAEIRTAVANANDSNVFTDNNESKLAGIEASAKDDQTDAEIRAAVEAANDSNVFTDNDHTKLNGIAAGAEVNITDNDFYDLGMDFLGKPTDAQVIARWVVLREITMPADFSGAGGDILTNPTGALVIDIKDDGTTIGTISISTSGVFTFTTVSGTEKVVAAGSVVTAIGPGTADATGEDIVFSLPGAL